MSADDPVVPLQAFVLGYANRDENLKQKNPAILHWKQKGTGRFADSQVSRNSDLGVFFNEIICSR
ncbi:hypothetical protein [Marinagarivorans algicola]|uniref:hypothetical protein n=1 Tax=Marinagarivorans algicola TaxID=1513270 RepID=UPI0012E1FBC7|nr:hypothetical protein [Marinagarivorans algicola]